MQNDVAKYVSVEDCAVLVRQTALSCYGVVGMASPNGVTAASLILPYFLNTNGVEIISAEDGYRINVYIIVEYGTTFKVVAQNLCDMIKYNLLKYYGVKVTNIKVFIKGVRKNS